MEERESEARVRRRLTKGGQRAASDLASTVSVPTLALRFASYRLTEIGMRLGTRYLSSSRACLALAKDGSSLRTSCQRACASATLPSR